MYWLQYKLYWCPYTDKSDQHQHTSYCNHYILKEILLNMIVKEHWQYCSGVKKYTVSRVCLWPYWIAEDTSPNDHWLYIQCTLLSGVEFFSLMSHQQLGHGDWPRFKVSSERLEVHGTEPATPGLQDYTLLRSLFWWHLTPKLISRQVAQRATIAHLSPMCQGQISFQKTYKWAMETRGPKSNSSELLCLSWLPATLMTIWSKMNELACTHHFPIFSLWEIVKTLKGS